MPTMRRQPVKQLAPMGWSPGHHRIEAGLPELPSTVDRRLTCCWHRLLGARPATGTAGPGSSAAG